MKLLLLFVFFIFICFTKANNLVGLEVDSSSVTIKTFNYQGSKSNPLPGNKLLKLSGAQPFRVSAYEESYVVSAVRGSDYYVVLANTNEYNQGTFLYAINLNSNELFIKGYSPVNLLYIVGLTYNAKSDQLVAVSSMNYDALEPYFDVVLIDPTTGEISKNLTTGNSYPDNTWYSGLYTSSESLGEIYILYQSMDEQTNNTISGFTTINAIDGTFVSNTWLNSNNNFVYSFTFNEATQMILSTLSDFDGKNLQFVSINPSNGDITTINKNSDQVCAGSGPVVIDGIFLSPGKEPKPSHQLFLVDTNSGNIEKDYLNILMSGISYLSAY
ncbi:hypothetical protein DICPUDRAFT_148002 [Dictyostelium purpureum]|uniref:Uncharacterized protein n=1 Tax=Dictyostelium purpureum TaxID=5786 RepID=F0Z9Z9_DICPU|nr:uncharacterized protein DICPUDRAFT_148002 [Dictyostelium purpureum]EGC39238.1 hypothetical protein DICPUDRAFT_148002 [Dictyostelium purpureum]|eukprot:XP_003284265.1 hypothetical protein DICPUDRAFT_148002 [Dictyostelium purpureum]